MPTATNLTGIDRRSAEFGGILCHYAEIAFDLMWQFSQNLEICTLNALVEDTQ